MKAPSNVLGFAVLCVVNLASCEQIKCQMTPVETEDGLMGYCCMFPKASFKEQFMHHTVKNGELFRYGTRLDSTLYPKVKPSEFHQGYLPSSNEKFMDQHRKRILDEYETRKPTPEIHERIPHRPRPPNIVYLRTNIEFANPEQTEIPNDESNDDTMRIFFKNFSESQAHSHEDKGNLKNKINNSSSNVSGEEQNNDGKNQSVPILNNRNNVNVPKTCVGNAKKTQEGNCEEPFV